MNIGGGEAADQMVRMMLSGGEVAVRLSGSAAKNLLAMSLALAKSHKKLSGKVRMGKMLQETRDIRVFPMTPEQYHAFRKTAGRQKLLYAAIKDMDDKGKLVDVVMPVTELDRANMIFRRMLYQPEKPKQQREEPSQEKQPETPKKDSRSERDSPATSISSPTRAESVARMTSERPSVEGRLKAYRAQLDRQRQSAPARQKTKVKSQGKTK